MKIISLNASCKLALHATGAALFAILATQPATAAPTFSTNASTGVEDMCNLTPLGGITSGDATAIAPQGLLIESCNSNLVNAVANASAGIAQGDVVLSDGAYVLGGLHTAASVTGPANAHARAIFDEILNIVPTSGFSDGYFYVTATYTIDGTLSGNAQAAGELQLGAYYGSDDEGNAICTGIYCTITPVSAGAHIFTITDQVPVSTLYPYLFVQSFLDVIAGDFSLPITDTTGGSADFSNTGTLSLTLPEGFTFTSDVNNGVLSPTTSVPEPPTVWLIAIALGGLGFLRHRENQGATAKA